MATDNMTVLDLEALTRGVGDLPTLPDVSLKVMRMCDEPDVNLRDLQFAISKDQALTARILKIVNSTMFYFEGEVSTLSHALSILGLDRVRTIVVAATVNQMFPEGSSLGIDLTTKLFWEHSWGTAIAAKALASAVGYPVVEEAFTCGLLHDMGKMVILKIRPDPYHEILNDVYRGETTFCDAELQKFGFTHAQVGALLTAKWHFPPQLGEGILHHHDFRLAADHRQLTAIVALANRMMKMLEIGFEKDKSIKLEEEESAQYLNLTPQVLQRRVAELQTMIPTLPGLARP